LTTGTPAGTSQLHAGDMVEVEIDGLGILSNKVQS
jgi:2-keto-4-pentenoate hydratase/2-oxohepta-3-ene-1,7-dioic acid hydratase in catechol pathway